MKYYPAYLNLAGKRVVVAGGGKVAERKVLSLLRAGADVTVISPDLTPRLLKEKERKHIRHLARPYRSGDLKNCFLVIAATDSPSVNTLVAQEAPGLVNVVDVPAECNFIVPSVITRGPLTIAISTSGISPALSKTIRKELEELYGHEFAAYLLSLKKVRAEALKRIPDKKERERFLKSLASREAVKALRSGRKPCAMTSLPKKAGRISG